MITFSCNNMVTSNFQIKVERQDFRQDRDNLYRLSKILKKESMRCRKLKENKKTNYRRKLY